jgi:hypothetical protein
VGAGVVVGGLDAIRWGGLDGVHPVGVLGTLIALAVSPVLGVLAALLGIRALRSASRRATRRWRAPVRAGQWGSAAALAFSHGANDAQKSVGIVAALLLADGRIDSLAAPTWVAVGRRAHDWDGAGRLADRPHGRAWDLLHPRARRPGQHDLSGRRHPGRLGRRRPGVHDPGGDLVRRGRRRWPPALAPRALAGRPSHGARVAGYHARHRGARRGGGRRLEVAGVRRPQHWFLPEVPDVLGLLRRQLAVTVEGMDAFAAWAVGDPSAADTVRACEHRADAAKRECGSRCARLS